MKKALFSAPLIFCLFLTVFAQEKPEDERELRSIESFTQGMSKIDGFLPLFYDEKKGKMFIKAERFRNEFLYQVSLPTGVGSNPIGLDRGQLGDTKVVFFERAGNKVLLVQPNYRFRALSDNPAERRAVRESFARSVIWGFEIKARTGDAVLLDATGFLIRDAHGVADRLRRRQQGKFALDKSRSAFYSPRTKGFPKNTEVEVTLTLTAAADTGRLINRTSPDGRSVTVRERHSFVELPDDGYRPRRFDPRVGVIPLRFYDYATKISENLEKRWVIRHRLKKKDPGAGVSEAIEPIVYYVDNGAPRVIREALIEGASWWNQAFEAAGYKNAFQVKVLPDGADAQDIRYNVINWVHRSTRGWAYGNSVVDPRTGEIIKGDVTLDSQRARQDVLIGTGLVPQYAGGADSACDFALLPDVGYLLSAQSADAAALAAARIRQLSAHEVGHTLGFAHNFAASTYGRASVMDYPAPLIGINNGKLDFSNAYARGIGSYDKFAVTYAYSDFPPDSNEDAELEKILLRGVANAMLFISDPDARPAGAAHPLANLWDNGPDPIASLTHEMEVRRIALRDFGLSSVRNGAPLSELENKLLPLFLHHRYQLTAAVKSIGGVFYTYSVRKNDSTNPQKVYEVVSPQRQREALRTALTTIDAKELAIPERILELIPPRAYGFSSERSELFTKRTSPLFDPLGAAEIAADFTIRALLEPNRAARLIELHARDKENPDLSEVIEAILAASWYKSDPENPYLAAVGRSVKGVVLEDFIGLASNGRASRKVRAEAVRGLKRLLTRLKEKGPDANSEAQDAIGEIERFLKRPGNPTKRTPILPEPPGDPIGSASCCR